MVWKTDEKYKKYFQKNQNVSLNFPYSKFPKKIQKMLHSENFEKPSAIFQHPLKILHFYKSSSQISFFIPT